METIKLIDKKPKKIILWKRIFFFLFIIIGISAYIVFNVLFNFRYRYYIINNEGNKTEIGIAATDNLVNITVKEYLEELGKEGYQITDFNLNNIITNNIIITWKDINNNEDNIKSKIKESLYIKTYAEKITCADNSIYVLEKTAQNIINRIQARDPYITIDIDFDYIDKNELSTAEQINYLVDNVPEAPPIERQQLIS